MIKKKIDTNKKVLMSGNIAIAQAAIEAGCRFYAGYPITPQNEIPNYMSGKMPQAGGVFIQAESEIAAINMLFGASAAGARAMTTSSSPGISLKQEGISYLAGARLGCVVVNVMRGGPGLGNIAPAQSDYFQATKGGGHGDYHTIVLAPSSVQEAYDLTKLAFDLADKYRTPVIILADGMIGQMMEPVQATGYRLQATGYKKAWALTGAKGRRPNIVRSFFLKEGILEEHNKLLQKEYQKIKQEVNNYENYLTEDANILIVSYGSMARIAKDSVNYMRKQGARVGLFRPISLWPFPEKALEELSIKSNAILVVEMSAGQMVEDVQRIVKSSAPVYFYGRMGGGIPSQEEISEEIKKILNAYSQKK